MPPLPNFSPMRQWLVIWPTRTARFYPGQIDVGNKRCHKLSKQSLPKARLERPEALFEGIGRFQMVASSAGNSLPTFTDDRTNGGLGQSRSCLDGLAVSAAMQAIEATSPEHSSGSSVVERQ